MPVGALRLVVSSISRFFSFFSFTAEEEGEGEDEEEQSLFNGEGSPGHPIFHGSSAHQQLMRRKHLTENVEATLRANPMYGPHKAAVARVLNDLMGRGGGDRGHLGPLDMVHFFTGGLNPTKAKEVGLRKQAITNGNVRKSITAASLSAAEAGIARRYDVEDLDAAQLAEWNRVMY